MKERLSYQDCVAGCIFVNIENALISTKDTLKILTNFYHESNLLIFEIADNVLEENEDVVHSANNVS